VTTDTLTFPTTSQVTTSNALGSSSNPVTSESAGASYEISGQVTQGGRTWTDTTRQQLQFGDDQSLINPSCSGPCYQWVHGEETQATSETVTGPGANVSRNDNVSWTIDAPNGFLQDPTGANFFLPASVNQQLTDVATQHANSFGDYETRLSESIIGYGALEEDSGAPSIADGDTTGTITNQTIGGSGPFGGSLYLGWRRRIALPENFLAGVSICGRAVRHPCAAAIRRWHRDRQMRSSTVKYMLLIIGAQDADTATDDNDQGLMEAFMTYHKAVLDAGVMVDSNVLDSFETATSVQVDRAGERIITDGPFAETREYLGGYYILDLPDLDTAIDWAARCPGARAGRIEVRPIQELALP